MYIWNSNCEKIGSLVLGHDRHWNIHIDKTQRQEEERREAEHMLEEAEKNEAESIEDKEKSNKELNLKVLEQIRVAKERKNQRRKLEYGEM